MSFFSFPSLSLFSSKKPLFLSPRFLKPPSPELPHAHAYTHLVKLLLARRGLFGAHPPLTEVDVPLVPVDAQDHHGLLPADLDQLVDRADAAPGELREEDHPFGAGVLEQGDVGAHLGNVVDLVVVGGEKEEGTSAGVRKEKKEVEVEEEKKTKSTKKKRERKKNYICSLTMTITTSSTSGNLASYILQSRTGGADILARDRKNNLLTLIQVREEDEVDD